MKYLIAVALLVSSSEAISHKSVHRINDDDGLNLPILEDGNDL